MQPTRLLERKGGGRERERGMGREEYTTSASIMSKLLFPYFDFTDRGGNVGGINSSIDAIVIPSLCDYRIYLYITFFEIIAFANYRD